MVNQTLILIKSSNKPTFIYDGDCPFCKYYAELSEIKSNIKDLVIIDARKNIDLCHELLEDGYNLSDGAIIIASGDVHYGWKAIHWISNEMEASNKLLSFLGSIFISPNRAKCLYPLLLIARKTILRFKNLSPNPIP